MFEANASVFNIKSHAKFILYGTGAKGDGEHTFFELHRSGAPHEDFFCLARCGTQGVAPMKEIK
jgi:hypothetical protein